MALRTPLSVTPHLYMGDSTGRPLDKGVVYFGEQDKDPEFYPINLFSDDALTKPLAQPVHTKGGYLYDKGDMVEPHAKELIYSVKVLDSYGRKVFYKGAMMRNSWNDDVIEQINAAIIGSADVARQVATDITNEAINNTAIEGGILADTFVTATANGADRVARTQRDVNSDFNSIKNFGVVGDGVADDTANIIKALQSGEPLDWLDVNCKITTPISVSYPDGSKVRWKGNGAKVTYIGSHVGIAVRLSGNADYDLSGVDFIASKSANVGLAIDNNIPSGSTLRTVKIGKMQISEIKRLKEFSGGSALQIRGGFAEVKFLDGFSAYNCELPQGQGIMSSIGIHAVSITAYSDYAYVRKVTTDNIHIEKVYSSDPTMPHDQDGFLYFAHRKADGTLSPSELIMNKGAFKNCYGRSIKTQIESTRVFGTTFERDEGNNDKHGVTEVAAQQGSLIANGLVFRYSNGFTGGTCVSSSTNSGSSASGLSVSQCDVYLDSVTVLPQFFSYIAGEPTSKPTLIDNVRVFGTVNSLGTLACDGSKNHLSISNTYVEDYINSGTETVDQVAAIKVITNGVSTGVSATVNLTNNITGASIKPLLVRDRIPSVSMTAIVSGQGNIGYKDDITGTSYDSTGLGQIPVARLGRIGGNYAESRTGFVEVVSTVSVSTSTPKTIPVRADTGTIVFITCNFYAGATAMFHVFTNGSTRVIEPLVVGSHFTVNKGVTPAAPEGRKKFEVYVGGNNEIVIANHDTAARTFSVFAMVTY